MIMPASLQLPDPGELVYWFDFWVPPTQYEVLEKVQGVKQRVLKVTDIFANERPRATIRGSHAAVYTGPKNTAEQANIRTQWSERIRELDIEAHFPWSRGKTGLACYGYATPPEGSSYWPGKPHTKRPDCSNMTKQAEDAIAEDKKTGFFGAFPDDSWVRLMGQDKAYGPIPGVWVQIYLFQDPLIYKPALPRKKVPK